MDEVALLLKAYWERLHELLLDNRDILKKRIADLLKAEVVHRGLAGFDERKFSAYREAAEAFLEERIEAYNPVGLQYLFDSDKRREAAELEFGLDWFNGRAEFDRLLASAARRAKPDMNDDLLQQAVLDLIREAGAYPDMSIIAGYEAKPGLNRLPDYIVAKATEEIICSKPLGD